MSDLSLTARVDEYDEDSDLEIIPNPEPARPHVVDLTLEPDHEDDSHFQIKSDINHNSRKRVSVKMEGCESESASKKRRINANSERVKAKLKEEQSGVDQTCAKSVDISKQHTKQGGSNSYHFWKIYPGLCYAGNCVNKQCVAYGEPVSARRGYGVVMPMFDEKYEKMKCPGCHTHFQLKGIQLFKCSATVKYQLVSDSRIKTKEIPRIAAGSYVQFGDVINMIKQETENKQNQRNERPGTLDNADYKNMYKLLEFTVKRNEYKYKF